MAAITMERTPDEFGHRGVWAFWERQIAGLTHPDEIIQRGPASIANVGNATIEMSQYRHSTIPDGHVIYQHGLPRFN